MFLNNSLTFYFKMFITTKAGIGTLLVIIIVTLLLTSLVHVVKTLDLVHQRYNVYREIDCLMSPVL